MYLICPADGRKVRHLITALLKSGEVQQIFRLNYCKKYTLSEGKVSSQEQKILFLQGIANPAKITSIVHKQFADDVTILPCI